MFIFVSAKARQSQDEAIFSRIDRIFGNLRALLDN